MTRRFRINAFAFAIVCSGALGLSRGTPAHAATLDGCADYMAARTEAIRTCQNAGYKMLTISNSWCSSQGYELNYTCSN